MTDDPDFLRSLKRTAATLRDAGVPFLLAGGFAVWAHGGTESDHDIDFLIKPADVERALEALAAAGMRPEHPPEPWLVKAWDGGILVDLIFAPAGLAVTDALIARGNELEVQALQMRVMRPDDVLVAKLMAMTEHTLNYESCLEIARSLREQIDWDYVPRPDTRVALRARLHRARRGPRDRRVTRPRDRRVTRPRGVTRSRAASRAG